MTKKIRNPLLPLVVFFCGTSTMVYELVGSRLLAPHVGTSVFVWTSLIGSVLASLSLGYAYGGRLADRRSDDRILAGVLFLASLFVLSTVLLVDIIFSGITKLHLPIEISSLIWAIILFSPASFCFGIISPYALRLQTESVETTGRTAGDLMALSTIGSIIGTFLAGYVIIPLVGSFETLICLSILLCILSLSFATSAHRRLQIGFVIIALILGASFALERSMRRAQGFSYDVDTAYNHIQIGIATEKKTGKAVRTLTTDPFGTQSAMYLDSDALVFEYTKYFDLAQHFTKNPTNTLLIGGCAYSYPKHFLKKYSSGSLDVIEIDPGMTAVARESFRLKNDPRLQISHADGRIFLSQTEKKYDAILIDAFNSASSIPAHLTTREMAQKLKNSLSRNGIIITNVISAIDGHDGAFFQSLHSTYRSIFPRVLVFQVEKSMPADAIQNLVLVALADDAAPNLISSDPQTKNQLAHLWKNPIATAEILTDNYAPVESLQHRKLTSQ